MSKKKFGLGFVPCGSFMGTKRVLGPQSCPLFRPFWVNISLGKS